MTQPQPIPRDAFVERLAELGTAEFTAFVAALHRSRGWRVEDDGPLLRLRGERSDPDPRSVLAIADASVPNDVGHVDRLIVARRPASVDEFAADAGVQVSGPDDLYGLLLYGIERETADALCREHLGRGVSAEPGERDVSTTRPAGREEDLVGDEEQNRIGRANSGTGGSATSAGARTANARGTGDEGASRAPSLTRRRLLAGVVLLSLVATVGASAVVGSSGTPFVTPFSAVDAGGDETATQTADSPAVPGSATTARTNAGRMVAPTSRAVRDTSTAERRYVGLTPTCERPPELVAVVVVGALRNNDPETDDGVQAAWNFSSRASQGATYRSFSRYLTREEFEPLFSHDGLELTPAYAESGDRVYRVTVTDAAGGSHTYHVALARQDGGPRDGCWLLAGIVDEW